MKQVRLIMGMPITVEVVDPAVTESDINQIFDYFISVDARFSTYKTTSEIAKINAGKLRESAYSKEMKEIFLKSEQTKHETGGYFDIRHGGKIDPSGIVKGWAIRNAAAMLKKKGFVNFYVDAGGDIQVSGKNKTGNKWTVGVRNPFNRREIVKVLSLASQGVATSGTAIRGQHVYDPHSKNMEITDIVSLTVIAPDIYDADRFATAAFAMGRKGIYFLEKRIDVEGYLIDSKGTGIFTSGFENFVINN